MGPRTLQPIASRYPGSPGSCVVYVKNKIGQDEACPWQKLSTLVVKVKVKFSRCRPEQALGDPEG
jgi:hypothetical protein